MAFFCKYEHHGVLIFGGIDNKGSNVGPRATPVSPANQVQWFYPAGASAPPFHHQPVPFFGYAVDTLTLLKLHGKKGGFSLTLYFPFFYRFSGTLLPTLPQTSATTM